MQSHLTQGDCLPNLFYKLLKPPSATTSTALSTNPLLCPPCLSWSLNPQRSSSWKANVSVYYFGSFRGFHISHFSNVRYFTTMAPRSALHIPSSSRLGVAAPTEVSTIVRSLEAPVRLRGGAALVAHVLRVLQTQCAFYAIHKHNTCTALRFRCRPPRRHPLQMLKVSSWKKIAGTFLAKSTNICVFLYWQN